MSARADAAEQTGERIIDAMLARFSSTPYEYVRMEDVATDAGITSQTVVRRFGSKQALMVTAVERELGRIVARREAAMTTTAAETIHALVEHYEIYGLLILKMYSEAPLVVGLQEIAARGREYHVDWCRRAFARHLQSSQEDQTAARRLAQVVAICDATTWRILRFDGDLSQEETERALIELIKPLLQ
jgi:AcrR family transcriptional regulator